MPLIHSFVNIFAGGRSETKVFLFFIYAIVIFLLYKFLKNRNLKSFRWKWFGVSLISLYLYGLFLHIFYSTSIGIKITDFIITGNNAEISSSTLSHTHIAKGFIGILLSKLGFSDLTKVDAGVAYIGLLPNILFNIGSIILIVVLIQAIRYFVSSYKKILINKNIRQKVFLILGYIIISFSIIKTSIDGGLLNYGFYISTLFIIFFIMREKGRLGINHHYLIVLFSIIFLITSIFVNSIDQSLGLLLSELAAITLLYEIILYLTEEKIRLQFLIPVIILFLGSWWQAGIRDLEIYNYGQNIIVTNQAFYVYDNDKKEVEKKIENNEVSIHKIIEGMGKNESYLPVTAPGITCMEKSPAQTVTMDLLTKESIKNKIVGQKDFINFNNQPSIFYDKYWRTGFVINMSPCLPEPLSVVDGMIRASGIDTYIIVNPIFNDEPNNL